MSLRLQTLLISLAPVVAEAQQRSSGGPADNGHGFYWGLGVTIAAMLLWGAASRYRGRIDARV